jgi:D-beta-D-heptose 7-phosphate kinase/D-beta-D-heptose 1-phosphate adenosyltransferase
VREAETYGLEALTPQLEQWRKQGLTVVFTNGVFDVLHVGHVAILEAAARHGQRLVVGVNSDASVRRLGKGADRPIQSELNRATLIGALRCVDAVVVFGEDTPLSVVQHLKPDVLVKGGDYDPLCENPSDPRYIVGSEEVKSWGGQVVAVPLVPGQSTSVILDKIRTS